MLNHKKVSLLRVVCFVAVSCIICQLTIVSKQPEIHSKRINIPDYAKEAVSWIQNAITDDIYEDISKGYAIAAGDKDILLEKESPCDLDYGNIKSDYYTMWDPIPILIKPFKKGECETVVMYPFMPFGWVQRRIAWCLWRGMAEFDLDGRGTGFNCNHWDTNCLLQDIPFEELLQKFNKWWISSYSMKPLLTGDEKEILKTRRRNLIRWKDYCEAHGIDLPAIDKITDEALLKDITKEETNKKGNALTDKKEKTSSRQKKSL